MAQMNKRGILLTLGLTLLSLSILSFAGVLLKNSEISEERVAELIEFERLYQAEKSIGASYTKIFNTTTSGLFKITPRPGGFNMTIRFDTVETPNQSILANYSDIFSDRLKNHNNMSFSQSILRDNVVFNHYLQGLHTQKFYLQHDHEFFIEYYPFPANFVFINKVNTTNIERINITIHSVNEPSSITTFAPCGGTRCVPLEIHAYGTSGSYETVQTSINITYVPPIFYRKLIEVNITENDINYTLSLVSVDISPGGPKQRYYKGLLITNTLTDRSEADSFADRMVSGPAGLNIGVNETLNVSIDIVFNSSYFPKHFIRPIFTSENILTMQTPYLETSAVGERITYNW